MNDSESAPGAGAPLNLAGFVEPSADATALEWALAYVACGMAVFPCNAKKRPLTSHGVLDATTDEATIRDWWTKWPFAEPAWAVPTEIVVVDLDPKDRGPDEFKKLESYGTDDASAPLAQTPSGGRHLVYSAGGRQFSNSVGKAAPGVDLRTAGGYVLMPNGINGRQWLNPLSSPLSLAPDWLPTKSERPKGPAGEARPFPGEATPYALGALRSAGAKIEATAPGAQNATLFAEACSIGELVAGGELDEAEAANALVEAGMAMANEPGRRPWTEEKVRDVVERGFERTADKPRNTPEADPDGLGAEIAKRLIAKVEAKREAASRLDPARPMSTIRLPTSAEEPLRDMNGDVINFADYRDPVCEIIPFPWPDATRLGKKQLALVNVGRRVHRTFIAGRVYDTAHSFAECAIDDLLSYVAERKGRPVEITEDARVEFIDEIGLEIALTVDLPIRGLVELSQAFLASPGFARFKAAVHEFYDHGVVIALDEADEDDKGAAHEDAGAYPEGEFPSLDDDDALEKLRYPGLVGDIVEWIYASGRRPSRTLALAATLPFIGALAGRLYASPSNLRTNLYCVGLAGSGFGKEISQTCLTSIAYAGNGELAKYLGGSTIMSGTALRKRVEAHAPLVYMLDEFGKFWRRVNNPKMPHAEEITGYLMQYYSRADSVFRGADYADESAQPCHQPNVCLYGAATPDDFWSACTALSAADGMLARINTFPVKRAEYSAPVEPTASAASPPFDIIKRCYDLAGGCGRFKGKISYAMKTSGAQGIAAYPVPYGPGAKEAYDAFFEKYDRLSFKFDGKLEGSFYARVNQEATKFALVLAIGVNPSEPVITLDILRLGQFVKEWTLRRTLKAVGGNIAETQQQSEYLHMLNLIDREPEGITAKHLNRTIRGLYDVRRRDAIYTQLIDSDVIVGKRVLTGGRPSIRIFTHRNAAAFPGEEVKLAGKLSVA